MTQNSSPLTTTTENEDPKKKTTGGASTSAGWCSRKNPTQNEKQTLILKLVNKKATVHRLLLTSHAYKIASKVHVSAVTVNEKTGTEETKKLGYVSFTENRESNFYARELKTIHLVAENCVGLKLEFDEAYVNEKNEHKQIGIAKIQIIGMTLEQKMANANNANNSLFAAAARTPEAKIVNSNARSMHPSSSFTTTTRKNNATTNTTFTSPPMFENAPCDAKTARRIQETQALKQKAVEVEDYDEAKRLRDVMSRLRKFGAAVAALEAKKMNAVRLEDYDTAKTLKAEIEKMDFDAFEKSTTTTHQNNNNNNSAASSPILGMRVKNDENGNEIVVNATNKSFDFDPDDGGAKGKSVAAQFPLSENTNTRPDDASAIGLSNDEIPARASGRAKSPPTSPGLQTGNSDGDGGSSFTPVSRFSSLGSEIMKNGENSTPQTTTAEEEEETLQLSASEERDMEPMFAMFSADVVARLIKSERWRTRDAALTEMNTVLLSAKGVTVEDTNQLFVSVCRVLAQKCLCDKIASAFIRACETLRILCTFCCEKTNFNAKSSGSTNVSAVLSIEVVPFLLERLAEAHARARDAAKETLAHVASTVEKQHESFIILEKIVEAQKKKVGSSGGKGKGSSGRSSSSSSSIVSSASSKPVAPRAMVKRLETLGLICSSFGMNTSHGVHAVNAASKALTFCCENLENNSGEVRKAAVESLAFIGTFTGRSKVRDKLPKTLKSSIRDAVERAVDAKVSSVEDKNKNNDDEEISDLKKKPSESATKNQTSSSRVAVEKEAASKVFEAPSNSFEFKKKSAASETDKAIFSRPREGEKQPEVDSEDDSDDDSNDDDEDEDDYLSIEELQRELSALSVTKGTRHPDYARVLVDLAAAKSDQEDYLGAVPLYEQALRIQENALGDDHPSSVQTLTDLAICRLDLGETNKGKPLLERALVLQKQQLGDDHADVIAIREVLMSL